MVYRLMIDEEFMMTVGSYTLLGYLVEFPDATGFDLVFSQTTTAWRRKHGGPNQWIVNEFTIPCLIEDILSLRSRGIEINVVMEELCED